MTKSKLPTIRDRFNTDKIKKMSIVALCHTEGVVLRNKKYCVLELAYYDVYRVSRHFLVRSPISYRNALRTQAILPKSLEVLMCRKHFYKDQKVYTFQEIIAFLQERYGQLKTLFGISVVFGYKGGSYQPDVLVKAGIPSFNIERLGCPSIRSLTQPLLVLRPPCLFHPSTENKCALHILQLILNYYGF